MSGIHIQKYADSNWVSRFQSVAFFFKTGLITLKVRYRQKI
jgi:hypothetical protein